MKVAFSTLGCRVNTYESEAMAEKFVREGYEIVDSSEKADVYVINTCSVTNMGDKKSRQIIGKARRLNEEAIIAAVGCYSQIAPDEVSAIEGVDVVLGTRNKGDIVYYVNKARDEQKQQIQVAEVLKNKEFEDLSIADYQDKTRAFLKIQDGCNRFCAYCLIPYTRGKEIILSGIHTASYGVDLEEKVSVVDILEAIENIDGIERVRIGSIDPTFFTEDVVKRIVCLKKLCPQFHLSLQSGCDATLKRMNRRYSSKKYEEIVNLLRDKIKDVSITTDVIVGFPGETDEEFNETYEFLKRIKLTKTHIFKYSQRTGTKAYSMENQVDGTAKDKRSKILIELNKVNEENFTKSYIGKTLDVLFEEKYSKEENYYVGYTKNYIRVIAKADCDISSKILNVKIENAQGEIAKGTLEI